MGFFCNTFQAGKQERKGGAWPLEGLSFFPVLKPPCGQGAKMVAHLQKDPLQAVLSFSPCVHDAQDQRHVFVWIRCRVFRRVGEPRIFPGRLFCLFSFLHRFFMRHKGCFCNPDVTGKVLPVRWRPSRKKGRTSGKDMLWRVRIKR